MNRIYLIQYVIVDDSVLVNRIKALGNWIQYFNKSWIVKSNLSAQDIYNKLSVDYEQVSFFIIELNTKNYWGRMNTSVWDWLKENN
jgi:hypothetical protein